MTEKEIRLSGFNGTLLMPFRQELQKEIGTRYVDTAEKMWSALWYHYLLNKGTISVPYYADMFYNAIALNKALKAWSDAGWITVTTLPERNWSEAKLEEKKLLEYFTSVQLESIRATHKFAKYRLKEEKPALVTSITRLNGKRADTGLEREGFRRASNIPFQFDTQAIIDNYDVIRQEVTKSMDKLAESCLNLRKDKASYDAISVDILDYLIIENGTYTSGQSNNDSRGRDIHGFLDKVFNPVAFKVARATLLIPIARRNVATQQGLMNKYLFIAELLGFKKGTIADKIQMGRDAYYRTALLDLDYSNEKDRALAYENIWLERTYADIDNYLEISYKAKIYKNRYVNNTATLDEAQAIIEASPSTYLWQVPIEIDMSASVLGYVGVLTNHKPFMDRCNMLGTELTDAWDIKGIPVRAQAKVIMRTIYGSSQSCTEMWDEEDISYTYDDAVAYNNALDHGEIAVGDRFSKFIISNCNPQETMTVNVRGEQFTIECNRFKHVGEKIISYSIYDSASGVIKTIHHTDTKKVPDLDQFRRFFVTCLIHNLDSQVENTTILETINNYGWAIDIHDAVILCAEAADFARGIYAGELEDIYENRNTILTDYFGSIGITSTAAAQWLKVKDSVEPLTEAFKCNKMVLK